MAQFNKNQNTDYQQQEIAYKNYNPFIHSLNKLLDDIMIIGRDMFYFPEKMDEYYVNLQNIFSKYSSYLIERKKISEELDKIEKFLYSSTYRYELKKYLDSDRMIDFTDKTKLNQRLCRNKLLEIFKLMNEQLAINGLIPTPEKREKELWEEEEYKSLRERKKAVLDVIFGGYNKK